MGTSLTMKHGGVMPEELDNFSSHILVGPPRPWTLLRKVALAFCWCPGPVTMPMLAFALWVLLPVLQACAHCIQSLFPLP